MYHRNHSCRRRCRHRRLFTHSRGSATNANYTSDHDLVTTAGASSALDVLEFLVLLLLDVLDAFPDVELDDDDIALLRQHGHGNRIHNVYGDVDDDDDGDDGDDDDDCNSIGANHEQTSDTSISQSPSLHVLSDLHIPMIPAECSDLLRPPSSHCDVLLLLVLSQIVVSASTARHADIKSSIVDSIKRAFVFS
jgi:hypothetical protein